jgi:hypothetical protein
VRGTASNANSVAPDPRQLGETSRVVERLEEPDDGTAHVGARCGAADGGDEVAVPRLVVVDDLGAGGLVLGSSWPARWPAPVATATDGRGRRAGGPRRG